MFIKVKRARFSASCFYTHTYSRTLLWLHHTLSGALSLNSLSLALAHSGCLLAWQRGLQQQQQQQQHSNKNTVQDSSKKEEDSERAQRKKKQSELGWAGLSLPGGWALLGACLFLCRVVTAAAASSSCSSPTAAVVEGCQPLFALIALSIFAAFKLFSGLCAPSRRPRRRRHSCCFF